MKTLAILGAILVGFMLLTSHPVMHANAPGVQGASIAAHTSAARIVVKEPDYVSIAHQDAIAAHINPTLFVRQIQQESGFNPSIVSQAGAIGIAQFMPDTAKGLGIDPYNPVQSLRAAADLMSRYQWHYGSYAMALAAYNAGPSALNYALATCRSWYACMPSETQRYITAIIG